jgi:VanZ family protein
MTYKKFWRGVFALLLLFVTWQTLTPDPDDSKSGLAIARLLAELLFHSPEYADKVAHFLAYAALGGAGGLGDMRIGGRRLAMVLCLAVYGMLLEFLQGLGGVRVAEVVDAFANAGGALAGFAGAFVVDHWLRRRSVA